MADEDRKTILLVEDEAEIARRVKAALEECGYAVIVADDGGKATYLLEKTIGIDLVLLDIELGAGIEGPGLANRLRGEYGLPIVLLADAREPEIAERAESLTVYGYAAKDATRSALDSAMRMAFKLFEAQRRTRSLEPMPDLACVKVLDITERKKAEESLQNERLLLRTLIDNIPTPIYSKDLAGRKTLSNLADARAMGGESEADVLGKTDFEFYPKEFAEQFTADDRQVMENGKPVIDREGLIPFGKGQMRWVLSSKLPLRDKDGRVVGLVGICNDIHERKRAEEKVEELLAEKELILKEVHHRIKNNMSVIKSILSVQAAVLGDAAAAAALEDAGNRVQSMMLLYEKLYQSLDFKRLSIAPFLSNLVDEIIANFPVMASVRVEKRIEDFILDTKRLQPIGLIVNEALTNILKHAFSGRTDGIVRVVAASHEGHVSIEVSDDGVGMPESASPGGSTGFGLMLIESLTRQIDGTMRIERDRGTKFTLEFEL